jgi:hypothetical protein
VPGDHFGNGADRLPILGYPAKVVRRSLGMWGATEHEEMICWELVAYDEKTQL